MSEISKLDQNLTIRKIDSETINIQIANNTILMSIVGEFEKSTLWQCDPRFYGGQWDMDFLE